MRVNKCPNDPIAGSESCRMSSMSFHSAQFPSWLSSSVSSSPGFGVTDRTGCLVYLVCFVCLVHFVDQKNPRARQLRIRTSSTLHVPDFSSPSSNPELKTLNSPSSIPHSKFHIQISPPHSHVNPFWFHQNQMRFNSRLVTPMMRDNSRSHTQKTLAN